MNSKASCLVCGGPRSQQRKFSGRFCSNACHQKHRSNEYIERWLKGEVDATCKHSISSFVRNYLIEKQKGACADCRRKKWRGQPICLELEHADGNWRNNTPSNVRLVCPNCHSQTPTYKAKNKGNGFGRDWRTQYPRRWET